MSITVLDPVPLTTVQDAARHCDLRRTPFFH